MRRIEDKIGHLDAALDGKSEVERANALTFDRLRFVPATLPEVNFEAIDLSMKLCGKKIAAPLMISPMTGGIKRGGDLNRRMAAAAERARIPFGVGSQRVAIESAARAKDFQVRDVAPNVVLFANLGAVQLVKGYGVDEAKRAIEMIGADAIYLHLNAMQEVVQEGGDTTWRGVLRAIEKVATKIDAPVFAREVGFGIPCDHAKHLFDAGVVGIDCAGGGGTSWTLVEGRVASGSTSRRMGDTFADWGLTTPESIREVRRASKQATVIASGGVRSGLDVAKAIALGATLAGMAAPVLRAAEESEEAVDLLIATVIRELRATFFGVGAGSLAAFRKKPRLMPFHDPLTGQIERC
jgi:isopentenyl-diphosphate delta-isomerase